MKAQRLECKLSSLCSFSFQDWDHQEPRGTKMCFSCFSFMHDFKLLQITFQAYKLTNRRLWNRSLTSPGFIQPQVNFYRKKICAIKMYFNLISITQIVVTNQLVPSRTMKLRPERAITELNFIWATFVSNKDWVDMYSFFFYYFFQGILLKNWNQSFYLLPAIAWNILQEKKSKLNS